MIIDCDTHLMPREAFDGVDGEFGPCKPSLKFNNDGLCVDVNFPGYPPEVPGTSPLLAPGSGAMFKSLWDVQSRMADYDNKLASSGMLFYRNFPAGGRISLKLHWPFEWRGRTTKLCSAS